MYQNSVQICISGCEQFKSVFTVWLLLLLIIFGGIVQKDIVYYFLPQNDDFNG